MTLEDLGVNIRPAAEGASVIVDTVSGILSEPVETAVRAAGQKLGYTPIPVFTYLANVMRVGEKQVPYSLITATDLEHVVDRTSHVPQHVGRPHVGRPHPPDSIILNEWTAAKLQAKPGDQVEIEYYLWDAGAGLDDASPDVQGRRHRADRGPRRRPATCARISRHHRSREPRRVGSAVPGRPVTRPSARTSEYWDDYRTTPKAFIGYERGRDLWRTRYGGATSMRFAVPAGCRDSSGRRPTAAPSLRRDRCGRQRSASPRFRFGGRRSRPQPARRTSASTSPTSASSSSSRRCCSPSCSSGLASNSGCGRSASCARPASRSRSCAAAPAGGAVALASSAARSA